MDELLNQLSDKFANQCDNFDDAQEAFDELDAEYNFLLGKYFVYSLSDEGERWYVSEGDTFLIEELPKYIASYKEYYGNHNITTVDDLTSVLEHRVMKDMSNAGCDPKTALRMILDDLDLNGKFRIYGADGTPKIEILD